MAGSDHGCTHTFQFHARFLCFMFSLRRPCKNFILPCARLLEVEKYTLFIYSFKWQSAGHSLANCERKIQLARTVLNCTPRDGSKHFWLRSDTFCRKADICSSWIKPFISSCMWGWSRLHSIWSCGLWWPKVAPCNLLLLKGQMYGCTALAWSLNFPRWPRHGNVHYIT